ncbi:MAG: hypothetical protein EXQ70_05590 [Solirubrobacterales bacterium]|nr:hypothetical protein [Solirubrobacterales bacterium]
MDAFSAICQGLGFAIALGLVIGTVMPPVMPGWGAAVGAIPLGVIACAAALSGADEAIWPALPVGALGAGLAAVAGKDVTTGAVRRQGGSPGAAEGGTSAVSALVILVALAVALVCAVFPPLALPPLGALLWLVLQRRRRAGRKYEGLRVLR